MQFVSGKCRKLLVGNNMLLQLKCSQLSHSVKQQHMQQQQQQMPLVRQAAATRCQREQQLLQQQLLASVALLRTVLQMECLQQKNGQHWEPAATEQRLLLLKRLPLRMNKC